MHYKRVDTIEPREYDGYSYINRDGAEEFITMKFTYKHDQYVEIEDDCGAVVKIYRQDIPSLIKALEAAYNHKDN